MKTEKEKEKRFYEKEYYRLFDYYKSENYKRFLLSKKIIRKNELFFLCDKDWLMKWKDLRGYDQIKDKLKKYEEIKDNVIKIKLKEEIIQFFIKREKEKNIDDIGKMNNDKLLRKDKKGSIIPYFEEESYFEPIPRSYSSYLENVMDRKITVSGEFGVGALLISNPLFEKNSKKKIVVFYLNDDNQFQKGIFTFNNKEDINKKINVVNKINFEEVIVEKEKEGKNVNEIEGMDFKIIKEDKIENIKEEHKKIVKERKNEKKNEKKKKKKKVR